jgi:hypothetical protein
MIIENLETEHIMRIANILVYDNWKPWHDIGKGWNGFDLLGDNYMFQLSYEGTIRVYIKEIMTSLELTFEQEEKMREVLNEILRKR